MNLELQLVNYHSTHLVPILADLTRPDNRWAGDHGMRARLHEQHHCWSWNATCSGVFRVNCKHLSRVFHRWPGKASKTVGIRWIAVTKVVLEHVVSPVGPNCVSVIPPKCHPLYFLTMFAFSDRRTLTSVAVILIHRNTRSTISTGFLITWTQCKV